LIIRSMFGIINAARNSAWVGKYWLVISNW
jgi:hypothetical protein